MAIDFIRVAEEKYCLLQIKVCRPFVRVLPHVAIFGHARSQMRLVLQLESKPIRFLQPSMQAFRIEERTPLPPHLSASEGSFCLTEGPDCLSDAFGNTPIMQKVFRNKAKTHCKAKLREIGLECGLCSQGYRKEAKHERSKLVKSEVHP